MIEENKFPVGQPQPRIDSFEAVEPGGPELTDEEKAWPVVTLQVRSDSFETISETIPVTAGTEVVIRVRCDASATAAEVNALVERLRSAVEGVRASTASRFPVEIIPPTPAT